MFKFFTWSSSPNKFFSFLPFKIFLSDYRYYDITEGSDIEEDFEVKDSVIDDNINVNIESSEDDEEEKILIQPPFKNNLYYKYKLLFFLRKAILFNKSRFSRAKIYCKQIVYFSLIINIILIFDLHSIYYNITLNLGYYYFLPYLLFLILINYIIKYNLFRLSSISKELRLFFNKLMFKVIIFLFKIIVIIFLFFFIRGLIPRYRLDNLFFFFWKYLFFFSIFFFLINWILFLFLL